MATPHTRRAFLSSVTLALPLVGCGKKNDSNLTPTAESAKALGPAISAAASAAPVPPLPPGHGPIQRRLLGQTGVEVSMLGLGGAHIGKPEENEAIRIMH